MKDIMCIAMATVVPMDYPLPLKQGYVGSNASIKTSYTYVNCLSSLCACIHTKLTETQNILEILL